MVNALSILSQPIRTSVYTLQKRFKVNVQKPRPPHHRRGIVEKFITPFISNPHTFKPWSERCQKITENKEKAQKKVNPYDVIIARECLNWFKSSNMVGFFHVNSITGEDQFNFAVQLKKANMYLKGYQTSILDLALKDTIYEPTLCLLQRMNRINLFVFSQETDAEKLFKISKKTSQVVLIAGILNGKLLHRNEFLEMGKLDLLTSQAGLVQVLRIAAGGNLNRQLTHHQSTLVTRLKQIGTKEDKPCDVKE
ncbi:large ribosomal subunit protein uL10m [Phymastichus coffea]|uniref:large ribosomal subunit protein uL10m n=1 Tax=Phymastichus coffea TaxID=108790 RepID=UPI00273AF124|nr:large ribosomal subunit protein uL10m [Phymastichus coffea]